MKCVLSIGGNGACDRLQGFEGTCPGRYTVLVANDTKDLVDDLRGQFTAVSTDRYGLYAFRQVPNAMHSGTPDQRDEALRAPAGRCSAQSSGMPTRSPWRQISQARAGSSTSRIRFWRTS